MKAKLMTAVVIIVLLVGYIVVDKIGRDPAAPPEAVATSGVSSDDAAAAGDTDVRPEDTPYPTEPVPSLPFVGKRWVAVSGIATFEFSDDPHPKYRGWKKLKFFQHRSGVGDPQGAWRVMQWPGRPECTAIEAAYAGRREKIVWEVQEGYLSLKTGGPDDPQNVLFAEDPGE